MLKNYITLLLLILSSLGLSQKRDLSLHTPVFISFNGGGTWHTTDVKTRVNFGAGFTLGGSVLKNNHSPIWLDIYGRFLMGTWKGNDLKVTDLSDYTGVLDQGLTPYKSEYGYALHNFKNRAVEFNLGMALHFKRLVQKNGIDPYIFGGIGLGFNRAWGNYLDGDYMYNFSNSYDSNWEVDTQLDNSYESLLDNNQNVQLLLTTHLGVGLAYWFTNNFSMGIEHKTTFPRNDHFDGVITTDVRTKNDIYHYTSLNFKWYLGGGRHRSTNPQHSTPTTSVPPVISNPVPVTPPCLKPQITLQGQTNSTQSQSIYNLNAYLTNAIANQTQVTINGSLVSNTSLQSNGRLTSAIQLYEGLNTIQISSWNNCGQDNQTIVVQYKPLCDDPIVQFTNPRANRITSSTQQFTYNAQITNFQRGDLIQVYVNGVQQNVVNVNYANNQVSGIASLHDGSNTIQIIATNKCGTHSQNVNIEYNAYCPEPIIQLNIGRNLTVVNSSYTFNAIVANVSQANQISLQLNGVVQSNVNLQSTTNGLAISKVLNLKEGVNTLLIIATNSCGNESETIQIVYDEPCDPVTLLVSSPRSSKLTTTESSFYIQATIANVDEQNDIVFMVNNVRVYNFTYNVTSDLFKANITLDEGANIIQIIAKNDCSTLSEHLGVTYTKPCATPTIAFTSPQNGITTPTQTTAVIARVTNVTDRNDLTVYLNGSPVNSFTFNNGTITIPVSLINGNNTIQVIATTNCGTISNKVNIVYNEPKPQITKPQIDFKNDCAITIEQGTFSFSGAINGVNNTDQITVLLNGIEQNYVNYTSTSNGFSFNTITRAGNIGQYTLTVIATNEGGTVTKTCTITVKNDPIIEICLNGKNVSIKESEWTEYQLRGARKEKCIELTNTTITEDTITVEICLNGVTMRIYATQLIRYKSRGATVGKCPDNEVANEIIICLKGDNERITKKIKESEWPTYQALGATIGECPQVIDKDIIICLDGKKRIIKESTWTEYQRLGATLGDCPTIDQDITICHRTNGTLTTLQIKQSQWATYQALGASLGPCPVIVDQDIVICITTTSGRTTRTIKQSQWASYERMGATLGACADTTSTGNTGGTTGTGTISNGMLICILENGKYVTKTINPLEWTKYRDLGAARGACTGNEVIPPSNQNQNRNQTQTQSTPRTEIPTKVTTTKPNITKPTVTTSTRTPETRVATPAKVTEGTKPQSRTVPSTTTTRPVSTPRQSTPTNTRRP